MTVLRHGFFGYNHHKYGEKCWENGGKKDSCNIKKTAKEIGSVGVEVCFELELKLYCFPFRSLKLGFHRLWLRVGTYSYIELKLGTLGPIVS